MTVGWLLALIACGSPPPPEAPPAAPDAAAPQAKAPADTDRPGLEASTKPVAPAPVAHDPEAARAAHKGDELFKAGLVPEAARSFARAIELDPSLDEAHLHLAGALSVLRGHGEICPYDAFAPRVLDELETAVKLNPANQDKLGDHDFDPVRGMVRFQALAGAKLDDPASLTKVLVGDTFYGPPQGVYGNMTKLDLQDGGKARLDKKTVDEKGNSRWTPVQGTWKLDGTDVVLTIDGVEHRMRVKPNGELVQGDETLYSDVPSECEA